MSPEKYTSHDRVEAFGAKLFLLWAGLAIGVAFLATPAKFLASSLTLPVALDVGQHTFRVYNDTELTLLGLLLLTGIWFRRRAPWYLNALLPTVIVLVQALWLIPALDLRVTAIQAGQTPLFPSHLHSLYVAAEVLKTLWLLCLGFGLSPFVALGRRQRAGHGLQDRWRS